MEHKRQLELAQVLKLSPTLLQSMGILQMTTLELADYLQDLALENPVMEETPGPGRPLGTPLPARCPGWPGRDGLRRAGGGEPGRRDREPESLAFFLAEQLDRKGLDQPLLAVCRYLVDLLDDHGRLDPEDLADLTQAGVPEALLEEGLPPCSPWTRRGWGLGGAGESLALQLKRRPGDHRVALAICEKGLDLLAREQYGALARRLGCPGHPGTGPQPRGGVGGQGETEYLRPDAWVAEIDGTLQIFVNQWDLPQFHLSPAYLQMAREDPGGEAADYLRQKIQQARWVLQCVRRRQETLTRCLTALVAAQEGFFRGGPRCRGLCWGGSWRRPWACIPLR